VNPCVTVLATGGTIACATDRNGDLVPSRNIASLLDDADVDASTVHARDILQVDSSTMTLSDLDALLAEIHAAVQGGPVVLTHGTDSMEETAMAVDRLIGGPVVLTGAQRPADDVSPDGPGNIQDALSVALTTRTPVVVLGGTAVAAYGATKVHTTEDRAFGSVGATRPEGSTTSPVPLSGLRVDIIPTFQGADPASVDRALDAGADGIVVAAFGSGNVGALAPGIQRAIAAGVPVVLASRVPAGGVQLVYGGAGGGREMERSGVRSAGTLTPAQARMELLCELAVNRP
jgi:L-asparaginase